MKKTLFILLAGIALCSCASAEVPSDKVQMVQVAETPCMVLNAVEVQHPAVILTVQQNKDANSMYLEVLPVNRIARHPEEPDRNRYSYHLRMPPVYYCYKDPDAVFRNLKLCSNPHYGGKEPGRC